VEDREFSILNFEFLISLPSRMVLGAGGGQFKIENSELRIRRSWSQGFFAFSAFRSCLLALRMPTPRIPLESVAASSNIW